MLMSKMILLRSVIQYSVGANFVLFAKNWLWNSSEMKGYPDDIWTLRIWTVKFPGDIWRVEIWRVKIWTVKSRLGVGLGLGFLLGLRLLFRVSVRFRVSYDSAVYDCPHFDCPD